MDPKLQSAKILTAQEEKSLDQKIEALRDIHNEKELTQGVQFEARDPKAVEARIAELEKIKQTHGAPQLSPAEKARAEKECELLTEDLRRDMPTWSEYVGLTPRDGARYTQLVRKIVKWEADPIRRQKIQRWKTLRRLLDRDDPMAASTMYLFPQ